MIYRGQDLVRVKHEDPRQGSQAQGNIARYRKVMLPGEPNYPNIEIPCNLECVVLGSGIDKNDLLNCRENGLEASFQEFSFIPYNHAKAYDVAEIHASARRDNLAGQQL